ncbi:hypothetical protein [Hymenobacter metallilatus]|uniref:Uncharacterized protein n=1 Tax=Hymenobacter metallilatus TaxID=2493666 RepID=A0A428JD08_9BACT|nr:hypothetical protein [Hymenobacter metallilatus]RSK29859.1 hypothetical protein EI290_16110 [Hymenobacter metallilatus]
MDCVRPDSLTAPAKVDCAVHFGQTVRMAIGRRGAFAAAFATIAAMKTLAAWNAAFAAVNDDKIILTPLYVNPQLPQSEAQFAEENTNGSINGKGFLTGYNAVKYTAEYVGLPASIKAQLEKMENESRAELGVDPVEMALITPDNRIISRGVNGIPFSNFYLQSVGSEGFKALNKNGFGISLDGKWDVGTTITQADFDLVSLNPV